MDILTVKFITHCNTHCKSQTTCFYFYFKLAITTVRRTMLEKAIFQKETDVIHAHALLATQLPALKIPVVGKLVLIFA